ncbi:hypothetical protein PLANTIT3_61056 [Plantibacter sp. T3]|nr:hypothetical protein PLANTIT3_61056 [Plantibacter sp. T3]
MQRGPKSGVFGPRYLVYGVPGGFVKPAANDESPGPDGPRDSI